MKAVYLMKKGILETKDIAMPQIMAGQVLIKVCSVGVCGSDIHYWQHGKIGKFVVEKPMMLGHEVSGEIAAIAPDVKGFAIGDKVVVEPGVPCGQCTYCRTGHYNLCPDMIFFATPPVDGAFCEYLAHQATYVYPMPAGMDFATATLVEPLSVGLFAARTAKAAVSDRVIIYGAGVIGLCCMMVAKEAGACTVTMVDIRDDRLAFAVKMGADSVINAKTEKAPAAAYDLAFECSGVAESLIDASRTVRPGGRISVLGLGANSLQDAPIVDLIINEQALLPSFRYANTFPDALQLIRKKESIFSQMITHRFPMDDVENAMKTAKDDPNAIKVVINL
jgi:L-iditol 2-dehydrogenase